MIGWLSLIATGLGVVKDITKEIRAERAHQKTLDNDQAIQASRERMAGLQAQASVQMELVKHATVALMFGFVQFALGMIVVVFLGKVVIWDIVLALGVTDDPSEKVWAAIWIILGGFFSLGAVRQLKR